MPLLYSINCIFSSIFFFICTEHDSVNALKPLIGLNNIANTTIEYAGSYAHYFIVITTDGAKTTYSYYNDAGEIFATWVSDAAQTINQPKHVCSTADGNAILFSVYNYLTDTTEYYRFS